MKPITFIAVPALGLKQQETEPHITLCIVGPRGATRAYESISVQSVKSLIELLQEAIK